MTAGLEILNDAGSIIIDAEFFNYALRDKRAIAITSPPGVFFHHTIDVVGENPLVALYCEDTDWYVGVTNASLSGGTWSYRITAFQANLGGTPPPLNFEVFIFDKPGPVTGTFGLAVYNANGEPTFDSNQKYMRVGGAPLDPSRKWAACFTRNGVEFRFEPTDSTSDVLYYGIRNVPTSEIFETDRFFFYTGGPPFEYDPGGPLYLPIDVTGY